MATSHGPEQGKWDTRRETRQQPDAGIESRASSLGSRVSDLESRISSLGPPRTTTEPLPSLPCMK
jgi:hypothetical protein